MEEGILYIVATPIGNLMDITMRALEVLKEVDYIVAEDTRHTVRLLNHYDIKNRLTSYHDYNKVQKSKWIIDKLQKGDNIALVSDAGTPGISDPAFYIVREAIKNGYKVTSIPGPTAFVSALVISGLPTDRFVFEGFLPRRKGRKKRLDQLREENRTIILYESPHRLKKTLAELYSYLGDREIAIARELTKKFEEVTRGALSKFL
ncbi:MAG: 16S rRNA (cytidine(1402)-2'-O)-methyltransferase, partial [Fidelibacterota bacterium]